MSNHNSAKYAFFYMLSLVALVFVALSTGMIIFQIINKYIVDIIQQYSGSYSPEAMKFAISAIIVATPIYFITTRYIYKSLYKGELAKDAGVRRWLGYLILLITIIVMIGWLIGIINNLLDGELTSKFILKALTAIVISGAIFSFYFYDMRREKVQGHKDNILKTYFFTALIIIIAVFVSSLFIVESPLESRNRKIDNQIINDWHQIDGLIHNYYQEYDKLPASLNILQDEYEYLSNEDIEHPVSNQEYEYNILEDKKYELCANFLADNSGLDQRDYYDEKWEHEAGYQCLSQKVTANLDPGAKPIRIYE
jgi:hypothetical protein